MRNQISKENINFILMPYIEIQKISQHMKEKTYPDYSYISFKKQQQKIHRNGII